MPEQVDLWLGLSKFTVLGGICAAVCLLAVVLAVRRLRGRGRKPEPAAPDLRIDVSALPAHGPPADGPRLEFYGTPVRLAVLVLAPAGRGCSLPDGRSLEEALETLLPGLTELIKSHRPVVRGWPYQLSSLGFTNSFFGHAALPGERGKGTPWCAAAGRFEAGGQQLLAGLICVADKPNSLSQVIVQHPGQWLDLLRIKRD